MEVKRYVVEIKGAVGERQTIVDNEMRNERKTKTNSEITTDNVNKGFKATIGSIATVYGASQLAVQPIIKERINVSVLTGDTVQARNLQRTYNNVNKVINTGLNLGIIGASFMVSPPVAVGMGVSTITRELSGAINRMQNNRMIDNQNTIDAFIGGHDRIRMTELIRG